MTSHVESGCTNVEKPSALGAGAGTEANIIPRGDGANVMIVSTASENNDYVTRNRFSY